MLVAGPLSERKVERSCERNHREKHRSWERSQHRPCPPLPTYFPGKGRAMEREAAETEFSP